MINRLTQISTREIFFYAIVFFGLILISSYVIFLLSSKLIPKFREYKLALKDRKMGNIEQQRITLKSKFYDNLRRISEGYFEKNDLSRLYQEILTYSFSSIPPEIDKSVITIEERRIGFLDKISEPDIDGKFYSMAEIREVLESDEEADEKLNHLASEYNNLKTLAKNLTDLIISTNFLDKILLKR